MAKKHKLVLIPASENKDRVKKHIADFVNENFLKGIETTQQDIEDKFIKPPYNIANTTVRSYIKELVEARKLSTYYRRGRRYYAPPKIPISIKFGVTVSMIIAVLGVIIDNFAPKEYIMKYIYLYNLKQPQPIYPSVLPIVFYLIILTIIFTVFSYLIERQK